jgi:Fe-S cluster assembly iron-binding protein IscA
MSEKPIFKLVVKRYGCNGHALLLEALSSIPTSGCMVTVVDDIAFFYELAEFPKFGDVYISLETCSLGAALKISSSSEKSRCGCGESFAL